MTNGYKRWAIVPLLYLGMLVLPLPLLGADLEKAFAAVHEENYDLAYQLFLEAAKAGDAEAQHNVGILIRDGKGTEKDEVQATQWFSKAAEQGWADAEYFMGNMYEFGHNVPQSYEIAAKWYQKAAEQGHREAQTNLAVLYANGQGVNQDIILAYVWSNLAASQGVMEALQNREMVAKAMSQEMLQNVRSISREYFQKYVAPFQTDATKRLVGQRRMPPPPEHQ